jgi:hypothetical protein
LKGLIAAKPAILQYSPDDFKSFFEQFVLNPSAGVEYIDAVVQIRDYQDPSRLLMTIGDKNYVDFRIGAIGNKLMLRRSLKRFQGLPFQERLLQSLDI